MLVPNNWTFMSDEVADNFDAHVREQLPWYDLATGMVAHISKHFITKGSIVYDIGASTGNISKAIIDNCAEDCSIIAIEESTAMASKIPTTGVSVVKSDAVDIVYKNFDLAVCFLTLSFISPKRRRVLLDKLLASVEIGGAVIIVDKIPVLEHYLTTILSRYTFAGKLKSGATYDSVMRKEMSLVGVQRPLHIDELHGFTEFFRIGDFAGFVYINISAGTYASK